MPGRALPARYICRAWSMPCNFAALLGREPGAGDTAAHAAWPTGKCWPAGVCTATTAVVRSNGLDRAAILVFFLHLTTGGPVFWGKRS